MTQTQSPDALAAAMADAGLKPGRSPVPVLRPDARTVFHKRAQRLRDLAEGHGLAEWLSFIALLSQAQAEVLEQSLELSAEEISPAQRWQSDFDALAQHLEGLLPAPAAEAVQASSVADRQSLAERLLSGSLGQEDLALAPMITAALQLAWTRFASRVEVATVEAHAHTQACPVCGSAPVAGVIHVGMESGGLRYLHCGLCQSAWHHVRTVCVSCGSDKELSYRTVEELGDAVRAETCDECHSYLKVIWAEKAPGYDPLAEDLAWLAMDILLGEEGYARLGANPFLLFAVEDGEATA